MGHIRIKLIFNELYATNNIILICLWINYNRAHNKSKPNTQGMKFIDV